MEPNIIEKHETQKNFKENSSNTSLINDSNFANSSSKHDFYISPVSINSGSKTNSIQNIEIGHSGGKVFIVEKNIKTKLVDKIIGKNYKDIYDREVEILTKLKQSPIHNYISEIYENYEDEKGFHIIMEFYDGNLKDLMNKYYKNGFDLNIVQKIMKIINKVVKYLIDELNILYKDIKPENILYKFLDKKKEIIEIKLCDFGLAIPSESNLITNKIEETEIYWSKHKKIPYNKDIYVYDAYINELKVLGNVMYELAFNDKNFEDIKNKVNYIEDEEFKNIINITCLLSDDLKPNFSTYLDLNFFKKKYSSNNEYHSITLKQNFIFKMEEAIELAKTITNYSKKEDLQKSSYQKISVFSEKLEKNSQHYSSFVKDSIFYVVYFENHKIKILKEIQSKYSYEKEIIKEIEIKENLNVKEIKFNSYFNCIFIFSEEIKYIDINDDFSINDLYKETKVKFASILNKNNQNKYLLFILNDNLELHSFKLFKENNIFKLIKDEYTIIIDKNDKDINLIFNTFYSNNIIYFYYYSNYKYYIYSFDENKNISKKENKSEDKIKNLLITNINNEIYLIFLTKKENKYLIKMQKYIDNKSINITHNLNSEIQKIKLINNENLLVLCFSTFQILNLKENYWLLHCPYSSATNKINECISVYHPHYKDSLLVLINENTKDKKFLLYYKTKFSVKNIKYISLFKLVINKFFILTSFLYCFFDTILFSSKT